MWRREGGREEVEREREREGEREGEMRNCKGIVDVVLHLDSYITAQFAGVCVAVRRGMYEARGVKVKVSEVREPGREVEDVLVLAERASRAGKNGRGGDNGAREVKGPLRVGVTEQYILQERGRGRGVTAFGAMFGQSPIALVAIASSSASSSSLSVDTASASASHAAAMKGAEAAMRRSGLSSRLCEEEAHRAYPLRVGVHEDTLPLVRAILPPHLADVVRVERESKLDALLRGDVDAVQVYDVLETGFLEARGYNADIVRLHGLRVAGSAEPVNLGYAQVCFAATTELEGRREEAAAFMAATMEGWAEAERNPAAAARDVMRCIDAWPHAVGHTRGEAQYEHTEAFHMDAIRRCCDYVKETRGRDGMIGGIEKARWESAEKWISQIERIHTSTSASTSRTPPAVDSLHSGIPQPPPAQSQLRSSSSSSSPHASTPPHTTEGAVGAAAAAAAAVGAGGPLRAPTAARNSGTVDGDKLAESILSDVRAQAAVIANKRGGRKPSLSVITVGDEALGHTHRDAQERRQLFAKDATISWYDKEATGHSLGIDVTCIDLPQSTSTDDLIGVLRTRLRDDGVQLMWPLPEHIDTREAYSSIPTSVDVDGAHFVGNAEIAGGLTRLQNQKQPVSDSEPWMPVTPRSVLAILEDAGVALAGAHVLVIGRSRIVGMPLMYALQREGATVTLAHSESRNMEVLCRAADVVIPATGRAGLVQGEWLRPGCSVINVGTTFDGEQRSLSPDLAGSFDHVSTLASCPGGVGPLSVAMLMRNVCESAALSLTAPKQRTSNVNTAGTQSTHPSSPSSSRPASGASSSTTRSSSSSRSIDGNSSGGGGATSETPTAPQRDLLDFVSRSEWSICAPRVLDIAVKSNFKRKLGRVATFVDHQAANAFLRQMAEDGDANGHHIERATLEHRCTRGVHVNIELGTLDVLDVTQHDLELARRIDAYLASTEHGMAAPTTSRESAARAETQIGAPSSNERVTLSSSSSSFASRSTQMSSISPPTVRVDSLRYDLPDASIARYPLPRGSSRLLVGTPVGEGVKPALVPNIDEQSFTTYSEAASPVSGMRVAERLVFADQVFADLVKILPANTHLVFNESSVFAARLHASQATKDGVYTKDGYTIRSFEVLLLSPDSAREAAEALHARVGGQRWRVMLRSNEVLPGATLRVGDGRLLLDVEEIHTVWDEDGEADGVEATVSMRATRPDVEDLPLLRLTEELGEVPLPPYMRRRAEKADREQYQTVYASSSRVGSVAAPTAGLHFSADMIKALQEKGVRVSRVALHVGAGTFKPVTSDCISEHTMHREHFSVPCHELEAIADSMDSGRPVVAVGTTSARVLESLYWLGARRAGADTMADPSPSSSVASDAVLGQWDAYGVGASRLSMSFPAAAAFRELSSDGSESSIVGSTSLCIAPGYEWKVASGLVTNFHAPDSSLMMLVASFVGGAPERILSMYEHALNSGFRFLSYGDASFLVRPTLPTAVLPVTQMAGSTEEGLLAGADMRATTTTTTSTTTTTAIDAIPATAQAVVGSGDEHDETYAAGAPISGLPPALLRGDANGNRVLLHSCCAPCSGAMVEEMQSRGLDITIFFYNPNIHPLKEYTIRKHENMRYAQKLGIPFVDADYDVDEWYRRAHGLEYSPERGKRCTVCFDMRFERTALYAHEHGFASFTTTNATSRWKDAAQVNESGLRAASKYDGVEYWVYDWQTETMSERKYKINAEESFYKQEYCGCSYSLRDSNAFRKSRGQPRIRIGGGGVYSDPVADSLEESEEVVAEFFRENPSDGTNNDSRERNRRIYAKRRKHASSSDANQNNW